MKTQIVTQTQFDNFKAQFANTGKLALTHLGGTRWLFTTALEAIILKVEEDK